MSDFILVKYLAKELGVTPRTVQRAAVRAKVKGQRVGTALVFSPAEADRVRGEVVGTAGNPDMQTGAAKLAKRRWRKARKRS